MRNQSSTRFISVLLAATFLLAQQGWAQDLSSAAGAASATAAEQQDNRTAQATREPQSQQPPATKPQSSGTAINPSEGPLQPVTTYPDAAGKQQGTSPEPSAPAQTNATAPNAPEPKTQQTEPQGAATAEKVPVAGGAAAKPAGVAIAPAKQHRTRSLLIKFGAVAAAGIAAGTIYALSRGTSSTPPGATSPSAVPK